MVFYTDIGKFHLYTTENEVIFVEYGEKGGQSKVMSARWVNRLAFKEQHMSSILEYLKSPDETSRGIGKTLLEQTLKVKIYGDVKEGHF